MTVDMQRSSVATTGKRDGFSLVEVMIVVGLIGILALVAGWGVIRARETARVKEAETQISLLHDAVKNMMWDIGYFPGGVERVSMANPTEEIWDLALPESCLMENPFNHPGWDGPYIKEIPDDPWGNRYFFDPDYYPNGAGKDPVIPVIGSFGPSGTGKEDYDDNNVYSEIRP